MVCAFTIRAFQYRFERPHQRKWDYPGKMHVHTFRHGVRLIVLDLHTEMGELAATDALKDAGIPYDKVEAVVASYCYGDPTCGMIIYSQRFVSSRLLMAG